MITKDFHFHHINFTCSKIESLDLDQQLILFYENLWFVGYTKCTAENVLESELDLLHS